MKKKVFVLFLLMVLPLLLAVMSDEKPISLEKVWEVKGNFTNNVATSITKNGEKIALVQKYGQYDMVSIYLIKNGALFKTIAKAKKNIFEVHFTPDDKNVIVEYSDKGCSIWDIDMDKEIYTFDTKGNGSDGFFFSNNGKILAILGADKKLYIFDYISRSLTYTRDLSQTKVSKISFSKDDKQMALASNNLIVLNTADGEKLYEKEFPVKFVVPGLNTVTDLMYSETGNKIFVGTRDGFIYVVNAANGDILKSIQVSKSRVISLLALKEKYLISGAGNLVITGLESFKELFTFKDKLAVCVGLNKTPDEQYVSFIGNTDTLYLFKVNYGVEK